MRPDLTFQVIFSKDRVTLASPTVFAEFGQEVRVEAADEMRAVVMAQRPDGEGRSFVSAKLFTNSGGDWQVAREMSSSRMMLGGTPSFEGSVEGTPYRFVIMPRMVVPAARDS
jgi:hypothetical protein